MGKSGSVSCHFGRFLTPAGGEVYSAPNDRNLKLQSNMVKGPEEQRRTMWTPPNHP